jgi:SAM-dependent methyltransferase
VSEHTPVSIPAPPGGLDPGAAERRQRFIDRTLTQRRDEEGRAVLAAEWHYIAALLGRERAAGGAAPVVGADPGSTGPMPDPGSASASTSGSTSASVAVLDLACGSGHQTLAWSERGFRVTGLDFDRDLMLAGRARLARAGAPAALWTQADATSLPFQSGSFDLVFNNSLLEHVPAWRDVLTETARVLRPGGVFVMYTTNRACPLQQEVNHFPFYPWLPDPVQRRVLAWIMKHRRDMVNFTDYPAVNWFTFGAMRRAFRSVGLEPYDRLDLMAREHAGGARGAIAGLMARGGPFKWPYYLGAISMALYGVRRAT